MVFRVFNIEWNQFRMQFEYAKRIEAPLRLLIVQLYILPSPLWYGFVGGLSTKLLKSALASGVS